MGRVGRVCKGWAAGESPGCAAHLKSTTVPGTDYRICRATTDATNASPLSDEPALRWPTYGIGLRLISRMYVVPRYSRIVKRTSVISLCFFSSSVLYCLAAIAFHLSSSALL